MTAEQSPFGGPPLNVESWIEHGKPGHWLTGKGATSDVAHLEISYNPVLEENWVREYAEGRKAFQTPCIEHAHNFAKTGKYAEAVIMSRMAMEIPWRGEVFMHNQGAVVRALGLQDYIDKDKVKRLAEASSTKGMEAVWADLDRTNKAMNEAFDTPYEVKNEMESIAHQGRQAIESQPVESWIKAITFFGDQGMLQAAGIGAIELAEAYEKSDQASEAISTHTAASQLLKKRLESVRRQGNPSRNTAEYDELSAHLSQALSGLLQLFSKVVKVKGQDKEVVKAVVYDLDDLGASATTVQIGYELLARSSRLKERHFYKREAAGIAGEIAVARFFHENPDSILIDGRELRRDRRTQRPPVSIVQ